MGAEKINNGSVEMKEENGECNVVESYETSSLSIDLSLSLPVMTPRIIELCKDLFKEWSELDDSQFSVETLSGGITNLLLKVTVNEESGGYVHVIVRLYGPNTDYVLNRERELQAIKYLSAAGFGAKLLGVFKNGMVQSFIHARTLKPSDMRKPEIAAEIAKELKRFHEVNIQGSKEPELWNEIVKFYEKASTLQFDDTGNQSLYDTISFKEIHNEILEIKELTSLLNSPIVFAHNDLLSGNLMLNEEEGAASAQKPSVKDWPRLMRYGFCIRRKLLPCPQTFADMGVVRWRNSILTAIDPIAMSYKHVGRLFFIDFEYGSYNYRGFDIGNHFNEYAGYDCDYSCYPSKEEQYHFFRHYLQPEKSDKVSQKDLEALYMESNAFMLASHLYWALWALIQARMSPIDFDYLDYFFLRYNEYKKQKEKYCSLVRSFLARSKSDYELKQKIQLEER